MKTEYIKNGDRYCSKCGEFLGATCDPFGRSECGKKCHTTKADKKVVSTPCRNKTFAI